MLCKELFSATRSEFKHLDYFYFHNCPYERLWRDNHRRHVERIDTLEVLRSFGPDYKAVFVGDAAMNPYEIAVAGGSVEHMNAEAGGVWRSEEHTSELQSLMRISYAVFCLKKKNRS